MLECITFNVPFNSLHVELQPISVSQEFSLATELLMCTKYPPHAGSLASEVILI